MSMESGVRSEFLRAAFFIIIWEKDGWIVVRRALGAGFGWAEVCGLVLASPDGVCAPNAEAVS